MHRAGAVRDDAPYRFPQCERFFFLSACSNRDAVPAIRVGADATPPLGFGQEGSMVKKATKAKTAAKKKAPAKRKVAAKKKK
jgi:hypothetical protein